MLYSLKKRGNMKLLKENYKISFKSRNISEIIKNPNNIFKSSKKRDEKTIKNLKNITKSLFERSDYDKQNISWRDMTKIVFKSKK